MIHRLASYFFLALVYWHTQLAGAQTCTADNVYIDLQATAASASIRLTGHSLVQVPGSGINYALLDGEDLHMLESGVFAPGNSGFNNAITNLADGNWLLMAVAVDGTNMNTQTVQTLTNNFAASSIVGNLQAGQGYVLVAKKNAGSALLEQAATFDSAKQKFNDLTTRVCAADMLGCNVGGDFSNRVLMARSGGTLENGYDADVVIGGHYEWSKCETDGLCVFVMKSNLDARFPQNGSIAFSDVNKFVTFISQDSILDSDYLVMAVDADASAIFHNAAAQNALSRWPATVSNYPNGASYLFIGRASDPSPIAQYTSTDFSVISLQCLNTQTGPVNPPGPTPAPTTGAPTIAPTAAPTSNETFAPTSAPTITPTPEPTIVVLVDIDISFQIHGENLTIDTTKEFTFQQAVVETIFVAIEQVTGVDLNISDFQIVNLTFHFPKNETTASLRTRRLEAASADGLLNVITNADIYQMIASTLEQIFDQDLSDIFNQIANGEFSLDSFQVVQVQAEPVVPPGGDDDDTGGSDGKKKSSSSDSDDASDWVSSTTGIVVIAVCGAVVVGAVLGGIFYGTRQRRAGGAGSRPAQRPAPAASAAPAPQQPAASVEQGKTPE